MFPSLAKTTTDARTLITNSTTVIIPLNKIANKRRKQLLKHNKK